MENETAAQPPKPELVGVGSKELLAAPFAERAEQLLSHVFGGMHHVYSLVKTDRYWTCIHSGDLATYDANYLTALVLAAHEYCLRVSISNGGPRALKIWVHDRKGRTGSMYERHPDIKTALETWGS